MKKKISLFHKSSLLDIQNKIVKMQWTQPLRNLLIEQCMKQNYFHSLLTTSSVSGNFCQLPHAGILRLDFIEVLFSLFFLRLNYLILQQMLEIWLELGQEGSKQGNHLKLRVESSPPDALCNMLLYIYYRNLNVIVISGHFFHCRLSF